MLAKNDAAPSTTTKTSHKLELDNHRTLSVTGVIAVPIFTDKGVTVRLADETLYIVGRDLMVKQLDLENGKLGLTGYVTQLKYMSTAAPSSIVKKIFK